MVLVGWNETWYIPHPLCVTLTLRVLPEEGWVRVINVYNTSKLLNTLTLLATVIVPSNAKRDPT